ncbi:MAG: hypothetical protein M3N98_10080 [Actinomycetota bacterium]|nr:hypothetical protein [Actinomycetota bacterium]
MTPEQLLNRRAYDAKTAKQRAKDQAARANDNFWTPVHPRGIVTIPRSAPWPLRPLLWLLLLCVYPFWFSFVVCWFLIGAVLYGGLKLLLLPLAIRQKYKDPVGYAKYKNQKWDRDILWMQIGPDAEPDFPVI